MESTSLQLCHKAITTHDQTGIGSILPDYDTSVERLLQTLIWISDNIKQSTLGAKPIRNSVLVSLLNLSFKMKILTSTPTEVTK